LIEYAFRKFLHALDEENMQNRSINIGGNSSGPINLGDNSVIQVNTRAAAEENIADIVMEVLQKLSERYPTVSNVPQKQTVFQMELQQKLDADPSLKQRFISSAKAGGLELVKVLTNNPFVSVPLETAKGWFEAEG
jgi:hypothetical protein